MTRAGVGYEEGGDVIGKLLLLLAPSPETVAVLGRVPLPSLPAMSARVERRAAAVGRSAGLRARQLRAGRQAGRGVRRCRSRGERERRVEQA